MRAAILVRLVMLLGAFWFQTAPAYSECILNTRLDCVLEQGNNDTEVPAWAPRPPTFRTTLFNSEDVQGSSAGCLLFASLLRHECSLKKPVRAIYTDTATGMATDNLAISEGASIIDNFTTLPNAFQRYFSIGDIAEALGEFIRTAVRLGKATTYALRSFSAASSNVAVLKVPARCVYPSSFVVCGISGRCSAERDPRVGDTITLSKVGDFGSNMDGWCSDADTLLGLLGAIEKMDQVSRSDGMIRLTFEPPSVPNFSAFSGMPLLNQVDGWIQGLAMDKYGDQAGKAIVAPGICLPTANAMMALGLKQENPGPRLGNRFDLLSPAGTANVRSDNANPQSTTQLQYNHHATHIDEMLRAGGLLREYPTKFSNFSGFFHRNRSKLNPLIAPLEDRRPIEGAFGLHRTFLFFEQDYPNSIPTQEVVETNFRSWIADRTAFTLGVQSSASQPPSGASDSEVIGHAITARGYSGSALLVNDPWKVASALRFEDYRYPDAGKLLASVNDPSYPSCIKSIPKRCKAAADSCLNTIQSVAQTNNGQINIPSCGYTGGPVPSRKTLYSKCVEQATCQKKIKLLRPNGTYRMLSNIGATPAYVGAKSAEGFKTSAYVTSYMTADPWPLSLTKDEFRNQHSSLNPVAMPPTSGGCTALSQGVLTIGGDRYVFRNPLPLVKGAVTETTSSSPVSVGCVNLHRITAGGSPSPQATHLFGSMQVTCTDNTVTVTSSQCGSIPERKACVVANGAGFQTPESRTMGRSFVWDSYGECIADRCNPGLDINPLTNSCECPFVDRLTGGRLFAAISSAGRCEPKSITCPPGTVKNSTNSDSQVSCVSTSRDIFTTEFIDPLKADYFRSADGKRLVDFGDPGSIYRFNNSGQVVFHRCQGSRLTPFQMEDGTTRCLDWYVRCNPGFEANPLTKSCECPFVDRLTGGRLFAAISSAGRCEPKSITCPPGTVKNSTNSDSQVSCVSTSRDIFTTQFTDPLKADYFRSADGQRLVDFADPDSIYRFNNSGQVEFHRCNSSSMTPFQMDDGTTRCLDVGQ